MIYLRIQGGLGNQMFQYALYKAYESKKIPINAYVDERYDHQECILSQVFKNTNLTIETEALDIINRTMNDRTLADKVIGKIAFSKRYYYKEKEDGVFDERILKLNEGVLDGYWQTSRYWNDIKNKIISDFKFESKYDDDIEKIIGKDRDKPFASIHIRGGDYKVKKNEELFGGICTASYYKKAINYIMSLNKQTTFVVVTNDNLFARETMKDVKNNIIYCDDIKGNKPDWFDMKLMSSCKYNILANSSFSWWSAMLNTNEGKIVLSPRNWINGKKTKDIWEEDWIKID